MRKIPNNPNHESNGDSGIQKPDFRPVPKVSQAERVTGGDDGGPIEPGTKTPFGGYWCSCKAGVVFLPGNLCLACREGWTPAEYRAT